MDTTQENNAGLGAPDRKPEAGPLASNASFSAILQALLKSPVSIAMRFRQGNAAMINFKIFVICALCLICYGVIVGSFAGGMQWVIAPGKILIGLLVTSVICLPSLYIFSCIDGHDVRLGLIVSALLCANALMSILLVGLGPVVWVFSQSTGSSVFMGFLHLVIWFTSFLFGMRCIKIVVNMGKRSRGMMINLWFIIFLVTCLQMMTALRPIIDTADTFLPKDKKFGSSGYRVGAGSMSNPPKWNSIAILNLFLLRKPQAILFIF